MRRYIYFTLFFFLLYADIFAQSYGLSFNSHEAVQENRTSLDLSPDDSICFKKSLKLEFDLSFMPNHEVYFGYILRLINNGQNIDLICRQNDFNVIYGQSLTGITFNIDTATLYNQWNKFKLEIDLEKNRLQLSLNGELMGSCPLQLSSGCFKFLWGANDHQRFNTRDIPPMRIKDVKLSEKDDLQYYWSLADTTGETSTDQLNHKKSRIKNPVWIKPRHQNWTMVASFNLGGYAGIAFDRKRDRLFIAGSDSMLVFYPGNTESAWTRSGSFHQNLQLGNQAIYDSLTDKLYDVFIDQKKVASFNFNASQWSTLFQDTVLTEYWHANKFVSPVDTSLYIIGGYGQLKYKNRVQRYHLATKQWDSVRTMGDYLPPRYLSALGTNPSGDTAYIIGGYGCPSGDQMLNPGNYYDLFSFDVRNKSIKKLFTLDSSNTQFVFANSIVVDSKANAWYGLIFENGSFDTYLQLVKGSLTDSGFQLLGSRIPFSFHDIQSFVDLYYSPISQKLLAVTLFYSRETAKEKVTQVKVFSIDFPPESIAIPAKAGIYAKSRYALPVFLIFLLTLGGILFLRYYKKRALVAGPEISAGNGTRVSDDSVPAFQAESKISLFGQFHVVDKEGVDITKLFTPLLKELFLLILIYTIKNNKGISSEALDEMLWHDKSLKDAKNNRSVNMAKLKTILEKLDHSVINKELGYWQFQNIDSSVYIDYKDFVHLHRDKPVIEKAYIQKLLQVTEKGTFLLQSEYTWLDDIKSEISNAVIDDCLQYMKSANLAEDAEFIIEISNCIFHFDRLNEDALEYKCKSLILLKRHALANTIYLKFTKEYKEIYNEDFRKSFNEIIKVKS